MECYSGSISDGTTLSISQTFVAVHPHDNSRYLLPITSYVDDCSSVINVEQEEVIKVEKLEHGKAKLFDYKTKILILQGEVYV